MTFNQTFPPIRKTQHRCLSTIPALILCIAAQCAGAALVGITAQSDFVQIDPQSGTATALASISASPDQAFTQVGVDAIDDVGKRYFVIRHEAAGDLLLTLDTSTGQILSSVLLSRPLVHLAFNAVSGMLFGITRPDESAASDLVQIDPLRGTLTLISQVGTQARGIFAYPGIDAVDASGNRLFAIRRTTAGDELVVINTASGAIDSSARLGRHLLHLAFSSSQGKLFGITDDGPFEGRTTHDLVQIDPASGALTTLRVLGDGGTNAFARPGVDSVNSVTDTLYVIRTSATGDSLLTVNLASGSAENAAPLSVDLIHLGATSQTAAPQISAPVNVVGVIGFPFLITVTATGTPAPVIFADLFPFGSIISETVSGNTTTAIILFNPVFRGLFAFPIVAQNNAGSAQAILGIEIASIPSIVSTPFAFGIQNTIFNFPLLASGSGAFFTTSTLPTGLSLQGNTIFGVPTQTGSFSVSVNALTDAGVAAQSMIITINDSSALGTTSSAGLGSGIAAIAFAPVSMSVQKTSIDLNFAAAGRDRISITGALRVPRGFVAAGQNVKLSLNGITQAFTLDAKGSAKSESVSLSLRTGGRVGADGTRLAKFTAKFSHGALAAALNPPFDNANVSGEARSIHLALSVNDAELGTDIPLTYSATQNKFGRARSR